MPKTDPLRASMQIPLVIRQSNGLVVSLSERFFIDSLRSIHPNVKRFSVICLLILSQFSKPKDSILLTRGPSLSTVIALVRMDACTIGSWKLLAQ
jgi:hypothetical protein